MTKQTYSTRSAAVRAARLRCKKLLGPDYQAFEGPDFYIHPHSGLDGYRFGPRFSFELLPVVIEESARIAAEKVLWANGCFGGQA
jgi:hypothetical protein